MSAVDLTNIRILWRQNDSMALYGIPYEMRADVGQAPRHLVEAEWPGRMLPGQRASEVTPRKFAGEVPSDWIWLGNPGWWGAMPADKIVAVKAFLAKHSEYIPTHPGEWAVLP